MAWLVTMVLWSPPPTATAAEPARQADAWTAAEIASAREACIRLLAPIRARVEPQAPIRLGRCGTPSPVMVTAVGGERPVALSPAVPLTCAMVVALHDWVEGTVQPLAMGLLGSPVVRLEGLSTYQCRNKVGDPTAVDDLSEHGLVNAIDIATFVVAGNRRIEIRRAWGPTARDATAGSSGGSAGATGAAAGAPSAGRERETARRGDPPPRDRRRAKDKETPAAPPLPAEDARAFVKAVHRGACRVFSTVIGPEANEAHRDHLHLDLSDGLGNNTSCD